MIEKIKSLLLKNGKIIPQRIRKSYLEKNNIFNFIDNSYDNSYSLLEKIYCLINNLSFRKKCKMCKNEITFNYGYSTFCSKICSSNDLEILKRNKLNVSKSLKKAYQERGDLIKEKRSKTLYKKYKQNVISPFSIEEIQKKSKKTIYDKYGVENIFYLEKYRSNGKKEAQKQSIEFHNISGYDIKYIGKNKIQIKKLCDIHGDVKMSSVNFYNRVYRNRNGIICTKCNPINSFSSFEKEFEKLLFKLEIKKYKKNTKKIIPPLELDFYFPEYNLAIELNGIYWHSEYYKDKNYHKDKTELCSNKNIQLIHIWEDDFYNKQEIIFSILNSKFNKNIKTIYARKCNIIEISSKEYRDFLEKNHIQGKINSSIRYGLIFDNKLVSVMGFGKLRISLKLKPKENEYELQRFCSQKNYRIIGGASKLLDYFEKNNNYKNIISYAKRDFSIGNLYEKLGFEKIKTCDPGFYWVIDGIRKHRYNYRKNKIINNENKNLTAVKIMHNKGYFRCFDSGNLKFIKEKIKEIEN